MKYALIESFVEFEVGQYRVRVWRSESDVAEWYDDRAFVEKAFLECENFHSPGEIAECVAAMDRVAAVHVMHVYGIYHHGIVLYNTWP